MAGPAGDRFRSRLASAARWKLVDWAGEKTEFELLLRKAEARALADDFGSC
jgi:hypothetical protein